MVRHIMSTPKSAITIRNSQNKNTCAKGACAKRVKRLNCSLTNNLAGVESRAKVREK
jgi:hypothetical protein